MDELQHSRVRHIYDSANFVRDLGIELTRIEDDYCETMLIPVERPRQQHGFIHAGVLAAIGRSHFRLRRARRGGIQPRCNQRRVQD